MQGAATKEQRVLLVGEAQCELLDDGVEFEGLVDQAGQLDEAIDELALALRGAAVVARERDHQHAERGELRGKGLGRGDANLGPGAGQHHEV